jgi:hypothetical protein
MLYSTEMVNLLFAAGGRLIVGGFVGVVVDGMGIPQASRASRMARNR